MKKKCQFCKHEFVPQKNDYNIEITDNNKLDIQLICPECCYTIEFRFIEQNEFCLAE